MQTIFKYGLVDDIRSMIEVADFIEDIYKKNAKPRAQNLSYSVLCRKYADRSVKILKAVIVSYATVHICFVSLSFLDNLGKRQMVPIFRINFPGVGEHSLFLNAFNYFSVLIVDFTMCSFDMLIYIIFANMPMVASIITGHLDELRDVLQDKKRKLDDINDRLIQIIFMHKKYKE